MFFTYYDSFNVKLESKIYTEKTIIGTVNSEIGKIKLCIVPFKKNYNNYPKSNIKTSVLKSCLQKCVRRKNSNLALKSLFSLFSKAEHLNCLRRIMVICVEDAMYLPFFSSILWMLMAVSKGFTLTANMEKEIADIIIMLCKFPFQDKVYLYSKNKYTEKHNILEIAKGYAGMNCDRKMFDILSGVWGHRFKNKIGLEYELYTTFAIDRYNNKIELITEDEIPTEALDFHISDIDIRIADISGINVEDVKDAIWKYSSSVNNRIFTNFDHIDKDKEKVNIWNTISILFRMEASNVKLYD